VDCDELLAPAVTYPTSWTARDWPTSSRWTRYLRSCAGAKPGDRIALLFDRPAYSYIGMLAVLKISAAYVPLDVGFPTDRMAYIVEDAGVSMVVTSIVPPRGQVEGWPAAAPSWSSSTRPPADRGDGRAAG
jgi:non-ribosomal peptide synthetase component F